MLGREHPDTLTCLNNLAVLLNNKGDYAAAEPLCRRALEGFERLLGPEHPETLTFLNNLARLLERKGDYAGAEPLLRRALEASECSAADIPIRSIPSTAWLDCWTARATTPVPNPCFDGRWKAANGCSAPIIPTLDAHFRISKACSGRCVPLGRCDCSDAWASTAHNDHRPLFGCLPIKQLGHVGQCADGGAQDRLDPRTFWSKYKRSNLESGR